MSVRILLNAGILLCLASIIPSANADTTQSWRQRKTAAVVSGPVTGDVAEEVRFGREVAARIIGRFGLYDNPALMRYVSLAGRALAVNTERQEIEFHFAVLNTDEINAYAAPGGYVFVTRGAVLKMQDEAELAGVLAHEISHVTWKHVVRELNIKGTEDSPAAGFAHLIGGTSEAARTAFAQAVDKALDLILKDGYKREDEAQADKTALSYAMLAGYDPLGLPRYLERLGPIKEKKTEVLDKTHPTFGERVAWLNAAIKEEGMDAGGGKTAKERFGEILGKIK